MKYYRVFYKNGNGEWEEKELNRTQRNSEKIAMAEVDALKRYGYDAKYIEYPDQPSYFDAYNA